MLLRRVLPVLLLLAPLAACQSTGAPTASIATATPFDPAQAAFIKKSGTGKIEGHAFWRTGEGTTINAAGEVIRLVPSTPYARERFATLYGGGRSVTANAIAKAEADPAYAEYTRTTRAESSGRFEFDGLAPGTYYVTAQIVYKDSSQVLKAQAGIYQSFQKIGTNGGAMFETVTVTGKETKPIKLVLTNDR